MVKRLRNTQLRTPKVGCCFEALVFWVDGWRAFPFDSKAADEVQEEERGWIKLTYSTLIPHGPFPVRVSKTPLPAVGAVVFRRCPNGSLTSGFLHVLVQRVSHPWRPRTACEVER